MAETWSERYVDRQVERAWLHPRVRLADACAEGLAAGAVAPLEFTAPTGESLFVRVEDEHVVVTHDHEWATGSPDQAALYLVEILRSDWEVLHPAFLTSPFLPRATAQEQPISTTSTPALMRAGSRDELNTWMVTAFERHNGRKISVAPNGTTLWAVEGMDPVRVRAVTARWILIGVHLSTSISPERAQRTIDRLNKHNADVRFEFRDGALVASRLIDARPFVAENLIQGLADFIKLVKQLTWVRLDPKTPAPIRHEVDPRLQAVLVVADRGKPEFVAGHVRSLAVSTEMLEAWLHTAAVQRCAARKLAAIHGSDGYPYVRLRRTWEHVMRAIRTVIAEQTDHHEGAA